jgi:subtilisin family serine protease
MAVATEWRSDAILVSSTDLPLVQSALTELGNTSLEPTEKRHGITRLESRSGLTADEVASLVDGVRRVCRERFSVEPAISPRHVVVVGQPNTSGNPEGLAKAVTHHFEDRGDTTAGAGVTVGVIDTGMDRNGWLDGAYLAAPADFDTEVASARKSSTPLGPQTGHGLFLSGLILQQAPGAAVKVWKVLDGDGVADIDDVVDAIYRAAASGVDILNLSLGCFTRNDRPPWTLAKALADLDPEIVVVASAGNAGQMRPFWPAAFERVVAVGAIADADHGLTIAQYSNCGPWVDLYVPASDVLSTFIHYDGQVALERRRNGAKIDTETVAYRSWATWSGTSMAAAIVSGAIARAAGTSASARAAARALLTQPEQFPFVRRLTLADATHENGTRLERVAIGLEPAVQRH